MRAACTNSNKNGFRPASSDFLKQPMPWQRGVSFEAPEYAVRITRRGRLGIRKELF
jgi:hypothetical protein